MSVHMVALGTSNAAFGRRWLHWVPGLDPLPKMVIDSHFEQRTKRQRQRARKSTIARPSCGARGEPSPVA